jgi:hypothetical protein
MLPSCGERKLGPPLTRAKKSVNMAFDKVADMKINDIKDFSHMDLPVLSRKVLAIIGLHFLAGPNREDRLGVGVHHR